MEPNTKLEIQNESSKSWSLLGSLKLTQERQSIGGQQTYTEQA